ncbi:protochlorophyllide-dependent translocon component 52, chloroplastic-like [Lolium perenne]|uniref:protochlorophyllide-dependent translocon component 52, chloroplastic-like n=1 Tax=Lolium perenne TaxID=4522 RepID=UPI003A99B642
MKIEEASVDGFLSPQENGGYYRYTAPFIICISSLPGRGRGRGEGKEETSVHAGVHVHPSVAGEEQADHLLSEECQRVWLNKIIPRWYHHIEVNAVLDSDIYLLHVEERNLAAAGAENWHKAVYVPTSSDGMVIAFRNWFRKHCQNQVGWAAPTVDQLPATPTKDKLMER